MRRTRRMTSSERWELGLFLAMLVVGCLCLTVILNLNNLPRIFAFPAQSAPAQADTAVTSGVPTIYEPSQEPSLLSIAPPTSILPGAVINNQLPLSAERAAVTPTTPAPKAKLAIKRVEPEIKIYNGKKYRYVKTLKLRVTAYAPDPRCTWPYPGTTTASGLSVKTNGGRLVAADTSLIPMRSLVVVPGYAGSAAVPVLDRGGAIKGHRLDVLLPTFDKAKNWGSQILDVKVYAPVDD